MQNYRNGTMQYQPHRAMRMPNACPSEDAWKDKSLAMAYVPWQIWRDIYETEKGFHCGTIFKELNLPFLGNGGYKR